jgi:hypothetical protein
MDPRESNTEPFGVESGSGVGVIRRDEMMARGTEHEAKARRGAGSGRSLSARPLIKE